MDGWIKLHRQSLDNPIVMKDPDHLAIWIYLLLNATHKKRPAMFGGKKIMLEPGQLITGRKKIAEDVGVNEHKVFRVLNLFKTEQQIEQQSTRYGSLITIVAWNEYQDNEQQNEQQMSNKRATSEQQVSTIQECKNERSNNTIKDSIRHVDEEPFSDIDKVITEWNKLPVSNIKIISHGSNREKLLKARIKQHGLEAVLEAIGKIPDSSFLLGQNSNGWTITFDWFIKPSNFAKVYEGNYTDREAKNETAKHTGSTKGGTEADSGYYGWAASGYKA